MEHLLYEQTLGGECNVCGMEIHSKNPTRIFCIFQRIGIDQ